MLPVLKISETFLLYTYPFFLGLSVAFLYSSAKQIYVEKFLSSKKFAVIFLVVFLSSWLGAKLLFLATNNLNVENLYNYSSFWLGGGFVFLGGLVTCLLFLVALHFFKVFNFLDIAFVLPSFAFAHAIGRLGCFLAGCCYGSITDASWAVHMHKAHRHPVQLYEAVGLILLGLALKKLLERSASRINILMAYIGSYCALRFLIEIVRGDKVRGVFWGNLSTSQIICLALVLLLSGGFAFRKIFFRDIKLGK
jgi:phosphatidylglycerol---prolipoprotein diacylglyceryl transferase